MFDKALYWKRRNNSIGKGQDKVMKPLRGQGDKIKSTFEKSVGQHVHFTNDGNPVRLNRAQSRKRFKDRNPTKKFKNAWIKSGDDKPVKFIHKDGSKPFKPSLPPSISNHQRHRMQQLKRAEAKASA